MQRNDRAGSVICEIAEIDRVLYGESQHPVFRKSTASQTRVTPAALFPDDSNEAEAAFPPFDIKTLLWYRKVAEGDSA